MAYPTGYLNPVVLPQTNITTDTATVQAAINAQNGPVVFPAGLFKLNALTMAAGTTFLGAGGRNEGGTSPDGAVTHLSLNKGGTSHFINVPTGVADVTIQDMILDGGLQANNPNCDVVNVADNVNNPDQVNLRMERVTITASGRYGLYVGVHRDDVKLHHCGIFSSYSHGLLTKGPDGVYDACEFGSNGSAKDQIGASGNNIEIQAVINRVTNSDLWGGPGGTTNGTNIGIVVMPGISGVVISGNGIDRHNHQGIYVDAGCYSVSIFNNVFHSNSQAGNGSYSHVYNDAGQPGGVMFDGNVATFDGAPVTATASYLLGNSQAQDTVNPANDEAYVGNCNYALVGGTTPGVTAGVIGWSQAN